MENTLEAPSTLSWIPQIFYDLIGRVIPGIAVIVSYLLLFQDSTGANSLILSLFTESRVPSYVIVLVGLVFSYLVGALLGAIGFFVQELKIEPPVLSLDKCPDLQKPEILRSFMYDAVQLHDPQAGARLAKLSAEQHMCRVLIFGFIALACVRTGLYIAGNQTGGFWKTIALFLAVASTSWLFHRHLWNQVIKTSCQSLALIGPREENKGRLGARRAQPRASSGWLAPPLMPRAFCAMRSSCRREREVGEIAKCSAGFARVGDIVGRLHPAGVLAVF